MDKIPEKKIYHRSNKGLILYDDKGIILNGDNLKNALVILWSNIEYISPTPAVKYEDGKWMTFDGKDLMSDHALEQINFFNLDIVVKNRKSFTEELNRWQKFLFYITWMRDLKPTYGANDKPIINEGFITLEVYHKSLSVSLRDFLNFINHRSKFDLLCHFE